MEPEPVNSAEKERQPLLVAQQHELLSISPSNEPSILEAPDLSPKDPESLADDRSADSRRQALDPLPVRIACAVLALLLSGFFSTAITYRGWSILPALDLAGVYLALSPLLFFTFLLGLSPTARQFQRWQVLQSPLRYAPSASIFICFILLGAFHKTFNPLTVIYILATCIFVFGSLSTTSGIRQSFYVEILVWMMIYIPFSLKWYSIVYYPGPDGYADEWFAVAITTLAAHAWVVGKQSSDLGYNYIPSNWKDVVVPIVTLTVVSLIVVPIGLATGFLSSPVIRHDSMTTLVWFVQHIATVAIPEELFFRSILVRSIDHFWPTKSLWLAQLTSSLIFSLMHLPIGGPLLDQFLWAGFAFICGNAYALCLRFTENKIFGPVITHATVNVLMYWLFTDPTKPGLPASPASSPISPLSQT